MAISTAIINTTKQVLLNVTNHLTNPLTSISNGTVNVSVTTGNNLYLEIGTLFATIALAGSTIWLAYTNHKSNQRINKLTQDSNTLTLESNAMYRTELESRIKPLLICEEYTKGQDIRSSKIHFASYIKNIGSIPARNVRVYNYLRQNEISLSELIMYENINENIKKSSRELGSIIPNGRIGYTSTKYMEPDSGKWHLAVWLEYDFLENKTEEIIHIFSVRTDARTVYALGLPPDAVLVKSYVNEDIIKSRKDRSDNLAGIGGAPN